MNERDSLFSPITTFIFDYDGVMTDGTVFSDHDGHPWRATNVKDGYALQLASKLGYHVAVISGAICPSMEVRMNSLARSSATVLAAKEPCATSSSVSSRCRANG